MPIYNVRHFGAVGDGKTNDTEAFQLAVSVCAKAGGGRVVVPSGGVYMIGTVMLASHIEFHVEPGAIVQASALLSHYRINTRKVHALFTASNATDIVFSGSGTIDGNGDGFVDEWNKYIYKPKMQRPFTCVFYECARVTVQNLRFCNAPCWTLWFGCSNDIQIRGIRIDNDLKMPNNDGIDIDGCSDVIISDCKISSGDDCIALKTLTNNLPCQNVIVKNCHLTSTSCAFHIGFEIRFPIRNIILDSCIIQASNRGIGIHVCDSGDVSNVTVSNIIIATRLFNGKEGKWWGCSEPIFIANLPRNLKEKVIHEDSLMGRATRQQRYGTIRNVRFSNIQCQSENGVFVQGNYAAAKYNNGNGGSAGEYGVKNIRFDNIHITMNKWTRWAGVQFDVRPCVVESGVMLAPAQETSAFMIKNCTDVQLRNCEVEWGGQESENPPVKEEPGVIVSRPWYYRHAIRVHGVDGFVNEGFRGESAQPTQYPAILQD